MLINYQPTSFRRITTNDEGIKYVWQEGGDTAVNALICAKEECKNYKWDLNITGNGYELTSPTTKKTHRGPFSIKKRLRDARNNVYRLGIKMDPSGKTRYHIDLDSWEALSKLFSRYKQSSPLEKVLILLKGLERTHFHG